MPGTKIHMDLLHAMAIEEWARSIFDKVLRDNAIVAVTPIPLQSGRIYRAVFAGFKEAVVGYRFSWKEKWGSDGSVRYEDPDFFLKIHEMLNDKPNSTGDGGTNNRKIYGIQESHWC